MSVIESKISVISAHEFQRENPAAQAAGRGGLHTASAVPGGLR